MALIVEDGTGKADADSYSSLAELDAYHLARGNTAWAAALEADKEIAAREGTAWLDVRYASQWQGVRTKSTQALDWPRFSTYDEDGYLIESDEVPKALKDAHAEAALRALAAELDPDQARGGAIAAAKVGPLSVQYRDDAPAGTVYPRIEALVRPLLVGAGAQVRVQRA